MTLAPDLNVDRQQLSARFEHVRRQTERLCQPLLIDDYQVQSILQTSPPKWHIAHVSWLFEAFILLKYMPGYQVFDEDFDYIFNSYYYTHGSMQPRAERGMLSRPAVDVVYQYRAYVDEHMLRLIEQLDAEQWAEFSFFVILGLNHEQQHQELLLMDIKHNFFVNPLKPAYRTELKIPQGDTPAINWIEGEEGIQTIGNDADRFAYDNETPRHQVLLSAHRLADRFVTNLEYLSFIQDGAYSNPALWLADGWAWLQNEQIHHPLYWQKRDNEWMQFTLGGLRELNPHEPVCHISYYEAEAYAHWAGKRLATESELECKLAQQPLEGNFVEADFLQPCPAGARGQWYGDLWAWTKSAYSSYPGFTPLAGSIGEYNGKFMSGQMVLKGASCVTPDGHSRASYRNFFYPHERWAFTGIRLAEDAA